MNKRALWMAVSVAAMVCDANAQQYPAIHGPFSKAGSILRSHLRNRQPHSHRQPQRARRRAQEREALCVAQLSVEPWAEMQEQVLQ